MKRFTETSIWDEDWYLDMPIEYKMLWYYIKDKCNHAGVWRPNLRLFEATVGVKVDLKKAIIFFNKDKSRIEVLNSGHWYILDFFVFQYGSTFNPLNRVHKSIQGIYIQEDINLTSIRGLKDLKDGVKDKDKDKDKDIDINSTKENIIKTWRNDFEIYKSELEIAFSEIVTPEYIKQRKEYHPNLDIVNTIEKSIEDYWKKERGWKNKKASKSKTIDWEATFNNALTSKMNIVYEKKKSLTNDDIMKLFPV
jgi:hypothetical protein